MSMTESEALEKLKLEGGLEIGGKPKRVAEFFEALFVAEEALKEIQQYRAIGTVSEFRELKEKATAIREQAITEFAEKLKREDVYVDVTSDYMIYERYCKYVDKITEQLIERK